MSTNASSLLSSKKTRKLSVELAGNVEAQRQVLVQVVGSLNKHIELVSQRSLFGRLKWLVLGK
jgi:hypothetical protein